MLPKALEEISKKLIDRLTSTRHGWAVLLFFALIAGAYLGLKEYRSSPDWAATLFDPLFATALWFIGTLVAVYGAWQVLPSLPLRVLAAAIVTIVSATGWSRTVDLRDEVLRIDVVFDSDALPNSEEIANFLTTVQQRHIVITLLSRPVVDMPLIDPVDFEHVKASMGGSVRRPPVTTHTVFVTSRQLSGVGWNNLFYVTSPHLSAISTFGILPAEQAQRQQMLKKYLASMIPLAALHGQALAKNKKLLEDRDPSTEHGCLHDFGVKKAVMMEKLRRGPKMCALEETEIAKVFGQQLVSEYKVILSTAAAASAP